jgi:hypothetical protein
MLIGGLFTSERLTVFGMVLVPAMAGFFYWFGWINTTSAGSVIVIITGCSHSGVCNIIAYARKVCNEERIRDVIGGFHLKESDRGTIVLTREFLAGVRPAGIHPCHCTSLAAKIVLAGICQVGEIGVGSVLIYCPSRNTVTSSLISKTSSRHPAASGKPTRARPCGTCPGRSPTPRSRATPRSTTASSNMSWKPPGTSVSSSFNPKKSCS